MFGEQVTFFKGAQPPKPLPICAYGFTANPNKKIAMVFRVKLYKSDNARNYNSTDYRNEKNRKVRGIDDFDGQSQNHSRIYAMPLKNYMNVNIFYAFILTDYFLCRFYFPGIILRTCRYRNPTTNL